MAMMSKEEGGWPPVSPEKILHDADKLDARLIQERFNAFLSAPEEGKTPAQFFEEKLGWSPKEVRWMLQVMEKSLKRFFNDLEFKVPDDRDMSGSRNIKRVLLEIIANDRDMETAEKMEPMVNLFADRVAEPFLRKKRE